MKAEEDQKISLDAPLAEVLPFFKGSNKDTVTVKEILSHFGRLQPWIPFYKGTQDCYHRKKFEAILSFETFQEVQGQSCRKHVFAADLQRQHLSTHQRCRSIRSARI